MKLKFDRDFFAKVGVMLAFILLVVAKKFEGQWPNLSTLCYVLLLVAVEILICLIVIEDILKKRVIFGRYGVITRIHRSKFPLLYWLHIALEISFATAIPINAIAYVMNEKFESIVFEFSLLPCAVAIFLVLFEDLRIDIMTREVNSGRRTNKSFKKSTNPKRYWIAVALKVFCLLIFPAVFLYGLFKTP